MAKRPLVTRSELRKRKDEKEAAGCEDRTHDLGIMRPTLFQLSQTRLI